MEAIIIRNRRQERPANTVSARPQAKLWHDAQSQLSSIEKSLIQIITTTTALIEQSNTLRENCCHTDADCYRSALHLEAILASTKHSAEEARQLLDRMQTPSVRMESPKQADSFSF